jgi:DNA-binding transcriptional regulator YhcF (GntR family)
MPKKRPPIVFTPEQKTCIVAWEYLKDEQQSIRTLARTTNVSWGKANRVRKMIRTSGTINARKKPGLAIGQHIKPSTTLVTTVLPNICGRYPKQSVRMAAASIHVNASTVRRAATRAGIICKRPPRKVYLTRGHQQLRLAFAHKHLRNYAGISWDHVFFTDSKVFYMNPVFKGGRAPPYWDYKGMHVPERYSAHTSKLHMYGGMCSFGTSRLLKVSGSTGVTSNYTCEKTQKPHAGVCGLEYKERILPELYDDACKLFRHMPASSWLYMHDNATIHASGIPFLEAKGQQYITDWGAKMAEVNIVENGWGWMDHKLKQEQYASLEAFEQKVQEVWASIPVRMLRRYSGSVPRRLQQIIDRDGDMADY